ncbi:MAG: DUF3090 domain-containing protein [Actinomycetota bacterium]|jgi:uncharacterized repeat protein (TIGR03847 family)|nr:DUF3090 domain-containing protein [Actinomycetota bacterium]
MSLYFEFENTDAFTAGALGEPGRRTFLLQVRAEGQRITIKCEKEQVAALSEYLRKLLADAPDVSHAPINEAMQLSQPVDPEFVLGTVGLAYDTISDRLVIQLDEIEVGPDEENPTVDQDISRIRAKITRDQAVAFCKHADDVVSSGRPSCVFCGRPINKDGHLCPRMN